MGDPISEAQQLLKEAENAAQPKKAWFGLSSSSDYTTASSLYNKAAIIYKGAKEWREAGDAYRKSADIEKLANEDDELARKLINAASCYKKCDVAMAIEVLQEAIAILLKAGRFNMVAMHEKEIAELYENQLDDPDNAIKAYERAAERYAGEDQEVAAQICQIKVACLSGLAQQYEKAAQIYEDAASSCSTDNNRKYQARDYLFRAGLARLCSEDRVATRRTLESYPAIDASFNATKEYQLLLDILEAVETSDTEGFTTVVAKFDRTNPLDDWKTKLLLRIKESINEEPSLT